MVVPTRLRRALLGTGWKVPLPVRTASWRVRVPLVKASVAPLAMV